MSGDKVLSHRKDHRRRLRRRVSEEATAETVDSISSLPEEILQHILSFLPTKISIATSVLSKRWRHVWCNTPHLSFDNGYFKASSINKTLARYTAPKMMSFHLYTSRKRNVNHIDDWIKFSRSRNVENLSLDFWLDDYDLPDSFFINSSVKEITLNLRSADLILTCSVSWTSLKKLSLCKCSIPDVSMAKILSGSPTLESLTLCSCDELKVLDLSESPSVRTLEVDRNIWFTGPIEIVAPHIHCLRLRYSQFPCTLVDVSSLTEATLDIFFSEREVLAVDFVQKMVLNMLEKLQNVEKLTLGGNFLQMLSLLELCGVPCPVFKIKVLMLETVIFQYVIPGIERILLNSPDLKKLTIHTSHCNTIPGKLLDDHLDEQGLDPATCWRSKDGVFWNESCWGLKSKQLDSFVELMLKNTQRLDKMVLRLGACYLKSSKEQVPTFSYNNIVSVLLCQSCQHFIE